MPGPESPCVPESQASPCRPNLHRSGANPRKPPRFGPLITSLHSGSTDTLVRNRNKTEGTGRGTDGQPGCEMGRVPCEVARKS